jgi:hypothetical protein
MGLADFHAKVSSAERSRTPSALKTTATTRAVLAGTLSCERHPQQTLIDVIVFFLLFLLFLVIFSWLQRHALALRGADDATTVNLMLQQL